MREKVLYVCTIPALESYSIGIISAAFLSSRLEPYACICLSGTETRNKLQLLEAFGIPASRGKNVCFISLSSSKVIRNLSGNRYLKKVVGFADLHQIKIIHFISQDVMLYGHLNYFKRFKLYYTVHDLTAHEVKLSRFQQAKHFYFRIRKDSGLIKGINNLITNSKHQYDALKRLFPEKNIGLHQMPGLVTPEIKNGKAVIGALHEAGNYALFFGKIELYKGIDMLYELFTCDKELSDLKLVIAGKGDVYFKRDQAKEENIIFLNDYIPDNEINDLFGKARMFILPYRSATQSAVTSLAYHYNLPVIAADIDGLTDTIVHEKTGLLYPKNDVEGLKKQILRLLDDEGLNNQIMCNLKKGPFYKINDLIRELEEIYRS